EVPHRLVACGGRGDRTARARIALHANAPAFALGGRNAGDRPRDAQEVDVGLRTGDPVLIGPCIDAADSELIHEVRVNRPTVRDLPVGGVLYEHPVADVDHIRSRGVLVTRLRIAEERTSDFAEILVTSNRELVLILRK